MLNQSICIACHKKCNTQNCPVAKYDEVDNPNILPNHCFHKLLHIKKQIKLSKVVCKECINKHNTLEGEKLPKWRKNDEYYWRNGIVECMLERTKITDEPPKDCLYRLEHIIRKQSKC